MSKDSIGIICIVAGLLYGSLAIEPVYKSTLGFLIEKNWIKPPVIEKSGKDLLGPKLTIIFYSLILICIGIYMLFAPSN